MAAVRSDSAEVKATLGEIVQLLQDYAEVHRALATPDRDVLIDAAEYLQRLGFALSRSRLNRMQIRVVIAADPLPLKSDRCRRLGLMVHELITNAARHACFGGRDGQIRVELRRAGPSAECIVSDNGSSVAGLKPGRGLKIVNDLVKALTGRLQHRLGAEGTSAALVFPLTDHELQASQAIAARRERTARRLRGHTFVAQIKPASANSDRCFVAGVDMRYVSAPHAYPESTGRHPRPLCWRSHLWRRSAVALTVPPVRQSQRNSCAPTSCAPSSIRVR